MLMQGFSVILHYNLAPPQAALTPKSISCQLFALFQQALNTEVEVKALVADHQEATRVELCELFAIKTENWVSRTTMCGCVQKLGVHRKKKPGTVAKPRQKESKN